jgi:hypothetical protein
MDQCHLDVWTSETVGQAVCLGVLDAQVFASTSPKTPVGGAVNTHLQAGSDTVEKHGDHEQGIGWQPTIEGEG